LQPATPQPATPQPATPQPATLQLAVPQPAASTQGEQMQPTQPKAASTWTFCDTCNRDFNTPWQLQRHAEGARHLVAVRRRELQAKGTGAEDRRGWGHAVAQPGMVAPAAVAGTKRKLANVPQPLVRQKPGEMAVLPYTADHDTATTTTTTAAATKTATLTVPVGMPTATKVATATAVAAAAAPSVAADSPLMATSSPSTLQSEKLKNQAVEKVRKRCRPLSTTTTAGWSEAAGAPAFNGLIVAAAAAAAGTAAAAAATEAWEQHGTQAINVSELNALVSELADGSSSNGDRVSENVFCLRQELVGIAREIQAARQRANEVVAQLRSIAGAVPMIEATAAGATAV